MSEERIERVYLEDILDAARDEGLTVPHFGRRVAPGRRVAQAISLNRLAELMRGVRSWLSHLILSREKGQAAMTA